MGHDITFDGHELNIRLTEGFADDRVPVIMIKGVIPKDFIKLQKCPIHISVSSGVKLFCEACKKSLDKDIAPTMVYINPEMCVCIFLYCSLKCRTDDEPRLRKQHKLTSN